jgi:dTDP-glucose 4,6-dehydratase
VRVRLFNTYGPGEHYSGYRSAVCLFVYRALHDLPYRVHTGHRRTSSYVDDTARTLANITDRFKPGEVYNIAGTEHHDMKTVSDIVLRQLGKPDDLVTYLGPEAHTTRDKLVTAEKARRDLDHHETVGLEEGIARTIAWQREVYGAG